MARATAHRTRRLLAAFAIAGAAAALGTLPAAADDHGGSWPAVAQSGGAAADDHSGATPASIDEHSVG
ncbi:hypothetical protein [Streptomyces mobaraensis]|uniref:Uncharacterized protein n=1 Tax=Streptomyces mobaraensis TaxID=35621 RepID=A0A5N5W3N6_STRMB|nr:hypothetical protein [Streptomyces mobaraensis]KAB7837999.1 hypothetical protein FRZ00_22545 [Streptomyces mobaraensis]